MKATKARCRELSWHLSSAIKLGRGCVHKPTHGEHRGREHSQAGVSSAGAYRTKPNVTVIQSVNCGGYATCTHRFACGVPAAPFKEKQDGLHFIAAGT